MTTAEANIPVSKAATGPTAKLRLGSLTALVIGSMVGSGVFSLPQNMAAGAGPLEVTDDITVRIEHADFGDSDERQLSLSPRLPQQGFGPEHRGCFVVLDSGNRPRGFCAMRLIIHDATDHP